MGEERLRERRRGRARALPRRAERPCASDRTTTAHAHHAGPPAASSRPREPARSPERPSAPCTASTPPAGSPAPHEAPHRVVLHPPRSSTRSTSSPSSSPSTATCKCKMCSVWEIREHGVPLDLAKKLLDDAYALGARTFVPCGAESFMRKDFLDLVEHAHALGYRTQDIVTNGTMITDAHLDRLEKCPSVLPAHLDRRPEGRARRPAGRGQLRQVRRDRTRVREARHPRRPLRRPHARDAPARSRAGRSRVGARGPRGLVPALPDGDLGPEKDLPRFSLLRTPKERIEKSARQAHRLREGPRASRSSPRRCSG